MKQLIIILISLLPILAWSQDINSNLTLEKAMQIAMEHNHEVKIAKNRLQQASNSNTKGNAGLLPSLSIGGNTEYSNKNSKTKMRPNGQVINANGTSNTTFAGSVRADYTLFGGFGKLYSYEKLQQNNERMRLLYRLQMENTILQTVQAYYNVCNAQQLLGISKKSISISTDRLKRVKTRQEFGQARSIDILNAEVDYNTDSTRVLNAELNYKNSIKNLNLIMGIDIDADYTVEDKTEIGLLETQESIEQKAMQNNSNLLAQQQAEIIARSDYKITQAMRYPKLSAFGTYGYYRQNNSAGQNEYMQQIGPTVGLSLQWNIFNGMQQRIREKNANLEVQNTQEMLERLKAQLQRDIASAYTDFDYKKRTINLEEKSLARSKLNFERTRELYKLGRATSLEFRTAQQNYLNAENNYNSARYNAKLAEILLLKVAGELVK